MDASEADHGKSEGWIRALVHRALQSLPLGASMRRVQRHLGCYDADDFRADLQGNLCRVITSEKFISRLLDIEDVPSVGDDLPDECIRHTSSRLADTIELIVRMSITRADEFWDIGCGVGGVSMLVAWLSGATTRGVEFHREYCLKAAAAAHTFALPNVRIIHADARDVSYASGSKFFMFMPFTHGVQLAVLKQLQGVAELHPITVGWKGPREHMREQAWLREVDDVSSEDDADHSFSLKVFRSR